MAENKIMPDGCFDNGFKEAVCIETARIYDSCSAKDCFEDLQVYFPDCAQGVIDAAMSVKGKKASVLNVYMDVEPVHLTRGSIRWMSPSSSRWLLRRLPRRSVRRLR